MPATKLFDVNTKSSDSLESIALHEPVGLFDLKVLVAHCEGCVGATADDASEEETKPPM